MERDQVSFHHNYLFEIILLDFIEKKLKIPFQSLTHKKFSLKKVLGDKVFIDEVVDHLKIASSLFGPIYLTFQLREGYSVILSEVDFL